jgi:uncharacterized membrane protein
MGNPLRHLRRSNRPARQSRRCARRLKPGDRRAHQRCGRLGKHGELRTLDRRTLLFLTLSGLATGLSWLCYFRALQLGPASRVAPLDKLSVPLVMVFAWFLLGEKITAPALVGGALITVGAVVMVLG